MHRATEHFAVIIERWLQQMSVIVERQGQGRFCRRTRTICSTSTVFEQAIA